VDDTADAADASSAHADADADAAADAGRQRVALERGPGVHVVADAFPARAGRMLAAALGADLAETAASAARALQVRLGTSDAEVEVDRATSDAADAQLAERLATYQSETPNRTLAAAHVARLRQLATTYERARRVRARTEEAARERLGIPIAGGAPGPRQAEAPVGRLCAPEAVAGGDEADVAAAPGGTGLQLDLPPASRPASHLRLQDSALIAGGVLLLGVALAGAVLLTDIAPIVAMGPILLGLVVASSIRRPAPVRAAPQRHLEQPLLLPTPPSVEAAESQGLDLPAGSHPLSAPGADATTDDAAVAAARHVEDEARAAWKAAWSDFGLRAPLEAISGPALDAALADLEEHIVAGGRSRSGAMADPSEPGDPLGESDASLSFERAVSHEKLGELLASRSLDAVLEHESGPSPGVIRPLVLVEPFAGVDDDRRQVMQRQLEALAAYHEVIVVVRDKADGPVEVDR
jgi:hypothetical protein